MTRPAHHIGTSQGFEGHGKASTGGCRQEWARPSLLALGGSSSSPCCPFKPPRAAGQQEPDLRRGGPGLVSPALCRCSACPPASPSLQCSSRPAPKKAGTVLLRTCHKADRAPSASTASIRRGRDLQVVSQRTRLSPKQCHCFHFCGFVIEVKYAYSKHTTHLKCAMPLTGTTAYTSNILSGYKPFPPVKSPCVPQCRPCTRPQRSSLYRHFPAPWTVRMGVPGAHTQCPAFRAGARCCTPSCVPAQQWFSGQCAPEGARGAGGKRPGFGCSQ